jgi:diacylglycerol kinase family enzyme
MKALLIYSHNTGATRRGFSNKLDYVKERLSSVFDTLDPVCTLSKEETRRLIAEKGSDYDSLVIVGGDGTFNNALTAIMGLEKRPTIGYLNFGTLGDVGKAFGLKNDYKKDVEIIIDRNAMDYDVGKVLSSNNTYYFAYTCCIGAYSDIPYSVERKRKRKVGKLAYYEKAVGEAFKKKLIPYKVIRDGEETLEGESPFLMIMNGTHMAGFKVNGQCVYDDGEFELYLTDKGLLNGLLHYMPFKNIKPLIIKECQIEAPASDFWCLDGEKGPSGKITIEVCRKAIKVFTNSR